MWSYRNGLVARCAFHLIPQASEKNFREITAMNPAGFLRAGAGLKIIIQSLVDWIMMHSRDLWLSSSHQLVLNCFAWYLHFAWRRRAF